MSKCLSYISCDQRFDIMHKFIFVKKKKIIIIIIKVKSKKKKTLRMVINYSNNATMLDDIITF